jgi:AcrR family transcriptional regulator
LDEAVRLFCVKGYPGTSMRDIADGVGLLPGSLYAHIDDKEGLLVEIVEAGINKFLRAAEPIVASGEAADVRMRRLIRAHVGIIAENVQQTSVVFHEWKHLSEGRRELVVSERNRYESLVTQLVDDGLTEGVFSRALNPRVTVLSILGILNWVPEWLSRDGPKPVDEVADRLADIVLLGLGGRSS